MYPNKYVTELVKYAIDREYITFIYYNSLSRSLRDIDHSKIIKQISLDEEKHIKMFKEIYTALTDREHTPSPKREITISHNISQELSQSIDDEFNMIELCRPLLFALENTRLKNYITEIMTDEQNHAARLIYMSGTFR